MAAFVTFEDVSKVYHSGEIEIRAVDHISFTIEKGEFCVIVGPSGAGKTTVLNMLGGMDACSGGTITVDGTRVSGFNARQLTTYRRHDIGFVFQFYNLVGNLTALENVELAAQICKDPLDAATVLNEVGLSARANNFPGQLSGGEQQRVAIARAIVNEPKALLLDEPLSALDLKLRQDMQYELIRLKNELGISFIFVTHDQEEALTMSDTVVVMNQGRIQQIGTPQQVYNEPVNAFVAGFIGDSNIIDAVMVQDRLVELCGVRFECVDTGFGQMRPVDVVIRPEDVEFVKPSEAILSGVVSHVIFKGLLWEMEVEAGGFTWLVQSTSMEPVGTEVGIYVKPFNIQVMNKPVSDDEEALVNE